MDYSLLLGVEKIKSHTHNFSLNNYDEVEEERSLNSFSNSIESSCGKFRYHFSIIDYLQKYNLSKRLERRYKILTTTAMPEDISSTESSSYADRFLKFIGEKVIKKG